MNHDEITWIGTHLGITNERGGLEAAQTGNYTVVNVAEEARNPSANIFAPLPLFSIASTALQHLTKIINDILSADGDKARIVIHDELGNERCGLVAAWLLHTVNQLSLEEAYQMVIEKRPTVTNYSHWIDNKQ